ncbi:MAG: tRNA (N6-isopentenyl adenosine(37)-C2)-methylthiotransferase MiaB [bacterium]
MIKFFIKTYGCQANEADSAALANYLISLNCKQVYDKNLSDLIVINTCAIRQKAEDKFFSYLGELAEVKKRAAHLKVIVIGCVATYRKEEIYKRFEYINFVLGAKEDLNKLKTYLFNSIVELESVKQIYGQNKKENNVVLNLGGIKDTPKEFKRSLINIMIGCNNYCSYCIVPFTKGREKSFAAKDILLKVKSDLEQGVKEITLLGQNVNSYKDPQSGINFAQLLDTVAAVEGDFWIRFVSPHPKDMTKDVLHVMAKYPDKLCAFIHHPLQSGSDKILKSMNRTYTVEKYLEQIDWIKTILPNATISTDIIVAFPGETIDDFEQTMMVVERVKYDNIYPFIYSSRNYTKASLLNDDVSRKEKIRRIEVLIKRQSEISFEKNSINVGKNLRVLVEKRATNGKLLARTQGNIRVFFDGDDKLIGSFVDVKIEKATPADLKAAFLSTD